MASLAPIDLLPSLVEQVWQKTNLGIKSDNPPVGISCDNDERNITNSAFSSEYSKLISSLTGLNFKTDVNRAWAKSIDYAPLNSYQFITLSYISNFFVEHIHKDDIEKFKNIKYKYFQSGSLIVLNKVNNNVSPVEQLEMMDNRKENMLSDKANYSFFYQILAVTMILIVFLVFWIYRLRREINLRISSEIQLKSAKEAFHLSHQRLALHRANNPLGVIEWNTEFEVLDWNSAAQHIFGFTKNEVIGKHITDNILPGGTKVAVNIIWSKLLKNKGGLHSVNENMTKDGQVILCEWHNTPLVNDDGQVIGVTSLVSDISEKNKAEEHLRLTEKMNAVGKLTGGIAHDFNNMLGVVLGFSQLLKDSLKPATDNQIKYCDEIINASIRAAMLTSKLLQFSRRVPSSAEKIIINDLLNNMKHKLEKTLTPKIKLIYELNNDLWPALLDTARMEDTILHLCINSMYAMPDGGSLTLNTSNIHLSELEAVNIDIPGGDYILLSVSDTGRGMNQEVRVQMFEPFFTTKGSEGTGLGLSHVYGFVQQSNGSIQVYSKRNKGTRIILYFPKYSQDNDSNAGQNLKDYMDLPTGKETVLIVDDEVFLLDIEEEILSQHGYTVLRAESAEQALAELKNNSIDLMLCDVIMPNMDGYQLATEVNKLYPEVKIQMVSGFSDARKIKQVNEKLHDQRLLKPVSAKALLIRLRKLLDEENFK